MTRAWARPNDGSEDIVSTPFAPLGYERIFRTYAGICFLAFLSVMWINIWHTYIHMTYMSYMYIRACMHADN